MKKIILGATALVLTAGVAFADCSDGMLAHDTLAPEHVVAVADIGENADFFGAPTFVSFDAETSSIVAPGSADVLGVVSALDEPTSAPSAADLVVAYTGSGDFADDLLPVPNDQGGHIGLAMLEDGTPNGKIIEDGGTVSGLTSLASAPAELVLEPQVG